MRSDLDHTANPAALRGGGSEANDAALPPHRRRDALELIGRGLDFEPEPVETAGAGTVHDRGSLRLQEARDLRGGRLLGEADEQERTARCGRRAGGSLEGRLPLAE